jgi:hypothetical protein
MTKKKDDRWREMMRRLRLGNICTLLRDRYRGPRLPDDDAGRDDLRELLMQESLSPCAAEIKMRNAIRTWAPWMPETERQGLIEDICRTPLNERRRTSQDAGKRLGVTNTQREQLRLWTIYPCDMSEEQMAEWRRAKDRARKRTRRQRRARADYLASHALSRTKPWERLGISRARYYRLELHRAQRETETSMSEVILSNAADTPVSPEQASPPQELAIPPRGTFKNQEDQRTQLTLSARALRDLRTHLSHGRVGKFRCEGISAPNANAKDVW